MHFVLRALTGSWILAFSTLTLSGCASTGVYLGADPGMHVPPIERELQIPIDPELQGLIDIRSIDMHGGVTTDARSGRSLYLSVDITGVLARPNLGLGSGDDLQTRLRQRRDKIIDVLLFVSDFNAETYLARAFANRTFIQASDSILQDALGRHRLRHGCGQSASRFGLRSVGAGHRICCGSGQRLAVS